eukprot:5021862-Pyramimonas_sp.AAC.1
MRGSWSVTNRNHAGAFSNARANASSSDGGTVCRCPPSGVENPHASLQPPWPSGCMVITAVPHLRLRGSARAS